VCYFNATPSTQISTLSLHDALPILIFWSVFTPAIGQNPAGHMVVTTDYELFGTSDLNGGGHVTWTLTGAKAAELRAKIVDMFDTYGQIPRGFPFAGTARAANGDGT